jgi:hypothetical protein
MTKGGVTEPLDTTKPTTRKKPTMTTRHQAKGPKKPRKPDPVELGEGHPYHQRLKNFFERDNRAEAEKKGLLDRKGKWTGRE